MNDSCRNWCDYWSQDNFWKNSQLWEINNELFFRRLKRVVRFNKNDSVLDIGCGSGYLEEMMAPAVKNIHAVDIAGQFVDSCTKRCKNYDNVSVGILGEDYTDLSSCGGPFSLILCVSVVQYYKNVQEIESLILSAKRITHPGAKMLIADLPLKRGKTGFLWDAMCSCLLSAHERYMWTLLRTVFMRWMRGSQYKSFYNQTDQLYFTIKDVNSLIKRMGIKARIVRENLSVYANRPSLLIEF